MKKTPKIGVFSFFSGAGFLDLGFETTTSFEIMLVNESHLPFIYVYKESRNLMGLQNPKYGYQNTDISNFLDGEQADYLISMRKYTNKSRIILVVS